MNKYLPSKKFTYTVISLVIAILIVWVVQTLAEKQSAKSAQKVVSEEKMQATMEQFLAIDTDEDGLKDWEEALWKTDSKKADTDEDGTNDGAEVKINRNPLKKAPGDEVDPQIIAENKKIDEDFSKLTPTEQFARVFFSEYVDAKNSAGGEEISETNKQSILSDLIFEVSKTSTVKKYKLADLQIFKNENPLTIKDYGNKFGLVIVNKFSNQAGNELLYASQALANQDEAVLSLLDPIIKEYNETIVALLALPVPNGSATLHVAIINNLENMKSGVEGMKKMFSDPLTAITAIQTYKSSATDLFSNLDKLQKYFTNNKVVFTDTDPGIVLFNFKTQI